MTRFRKFMVRFMLGLVGIKLWGDHKVSFLAIAPFFYWAFGIYCTIRTIVVVILDRDVFYWFDGLWLAIFLTYWWLEFWYPRIWPLTEEEKKQQQIN